MYIKGIVTPGQDEKQLIELLSAGKTHAQISHILQCSIRTINSKVYRLQKKYNTRNAVQLVAMFVTNKWIRYEHQVES